MRPLLRSDMPYADGHGCLDFLTPELRERFAIIDSEAVSVNEYDGYALALIEKHRDGLILDCGAWQRPVYYQNVATTHSTQCFRSRCSSTSKIRSLALEKSSAS